MADFYPILSRAVSGLPDRSPEARRAIYERAKVALLTQLRGLDPPLGEAEIMRERLSLEEAMTRVEADYGETAQDTLPPDFAGLVRDVGPREADAGDEPASATDPFAEANPPRMAAAPERDPPAFEQPDPSERVASDAQGVRPRVAPPRESRVRPGHVRTAILGGGVALAVAAVAAAAVYVNKIKPPETPVAQRTETSAQPAQGEPAGKINERVGEAGAQPSRTPATPSQAVPPGTEVAVAQRAILYAENPDNPQQPRVIAGRAFWRLDSESAGQGRPVETIVRATVEVPDAGFSLDFTVRRNTDSAFPASHIIGLRFTVTGDPATDAVREVGVPQFKTEEGERGAPLSAINSALGDNLFVAALSSVPVEVERNIELILSRNWIDVPVRFASGRRGIITFEKGISGGQTLADAFGRWR